jgi:hypothetical protein
MRVDEPRHDPGAVEIDDRVDVTRRRADVTPGPDGNDASVARDERVVHRTAEVGTDPSAAE